MRFLLRALVLAIAAAPSLAAPSRAAAQRAPALRVDVLVYGGTSAGVIAAYTARMAGRTVLLVEPGRTSAG